MREDVTVSIPAAHKRQSAIDERQRQLVGLSRKRRIISEQLQEMEYAIERGDKQKVAKIKRNILSIV